MQASCIWFRGNRNSGGQWVAGQVNLRCGYRSPPSGYPIVRAALLPSPGQICFRWGACLVVFFGRGVVWGVGFPGSGGFCREIEEIRFFRELNVLKGVLLVREQLLEVKKSVFGVFFAVGVFSGKGDGPGRGQGQGDCLRRQGFFCVQEKKWSREGTRFGEAL